MFDIHLLSGINIQKYICKDALYYVNLEP